MKERLSERKRERSGSVHSQFICLCYLKKILCACLDFNFELLSNRFLMLLLLLLQWMLLLLLQHSLLLLLLHIYYALWLLWRLKL